MTISDQQFEDFLEQAIARTPPMYKERLQNVAFLLADQPSAQQRSQLALRDDQLLFGLYEGTPLPQRGGALKVLPDKITLFKQPLLAVSRTESELRENVNHTVWHEIAHYFGLDHSQIYELDGTERAGESQKT